MRGWCVRMAPRSVNRTFVRDMRAFDGGEKLTGKEKNDFARGLKQGIISAIVHKDLSGRVPVLVRGHRERGVYIQEWEKGFL